MSLKSRLVSFFRSLFPNKPEVPGSQYESFSEMFKEVIGVLIQHPGAQVLSVDNPANQSLIWIVRYHHKGQRKEFKWEVALSQVARLIEAEEISKRLIYQDCMNSSRGRIHLARALQNKVLAA